MTGVLVVGAGPTGLALACGLLQHGVSVPGIPTVLLLACDLGEIAVRVEHRRGDITHVDGPLG